MKTMKKLFALLLAVLMVMGMATTAMADDITITVKNAPDGHSYAAYQIFKGKLHEGVLTELQWGSDNLGSALLVELKKESSAGTKYPLFSKENVNLFGSATDAASVASVLVGWPYNEADIQKFADVVASVIYANNSDTNSENNIPVAATAAATNGTCTLNVTNSGTGYYLIVDTTDNLTVEGATDFLLQIVGPTEVATKSSKPTFSKSVHTALEGTYTKVVDAEITDQFALSNLEKDDKGKFTDAAMTTLGTSNAVWFKLEAKLPSLFNFYNQYYLEFEDEVPAGLAPIKGSSHKNVYLLHENNTRTILNVDTEVTEKKDANGEVTGYTISLNLGDLKRQLADVTFNLNDTIVLKYATHVVPNAVLGNGTTSGNKNTAKMIFSADMNEKNITGYKTAEMTDSASVYTYQATFTKVDSVTKVPLAGAKFILFRNRTINDVLTPYYAIIDKDTGWITDWTPDESDATKLESSTVTKTGDTYTGGTFTVKGLDALSYHLKEVTPPDGYEPMKETVLFTINKEFGTDSTLKSVSITIDGGTSDGAVASGSVTGSINNTKGTVLPTTGGIGTTIFYIVGGVLVLGAGAAFVMKRRNEA